MDNKRIYDNYAFISYKREDEKWAEWLQRKLEGYKLPTRRQIRHCPGIYVQSSGTRQIWGVVY